MPTLSKRAIAYARRFPGNSATQIANALKARPSSVSSALYRAVKRGELSRTEATFDGCRWHSVGGGGPAGGHVYGPKSYYDASPETSTP